MWLLVVCIIGCELVGIIGGLATATSVRTWYKKLKKPVFNPPPFLFGPVWTILYALMGYSLYMILITPCRSKTLLLSLFFAQLCLNFLWSFIFFYYHKLFLAFLEILFMLFFIILTAVAFYPVNHTAGLLLIPYIAWVSFASLLNGSLWKLNRKKRRK